MNMKRMSKVLSLVLLFGMLLSLLPAAALAADGATAALKESVAAGDKVVIYYPVEKKVASTEDYFYNNKKHELVSLDATVEDGKMTVPEGAAILTVQVNDDGQYSFVTDEGKYLYADGTHVQFVDEAGENTLFVLEDTTSTNYAGHFIRCATANYNGKAQYLEYYGGYFSVYGMNNSNADIYTFQFFALESAEEPQPTYNTVAEALAGEEGAEFTVKAVVTMIDGKNVYVQDATGGICLYFSAAPTGLALGDTVIGNGKRMTYRGLPELGEASFEKSEGLTLEAKETTIDALTTADVCTYVKLSDLTVTEVYDKNGEYSTPNIKVADAEGHEIQIYKAVVGKTGDEWDVKVDDKVDVTAAVGVNNTTLQLRNTLASEITVKTEEPQPAYNTVAEALAGETGAAFTVKAVVTMIDGKNVFVQDATGGICLFFDAAPTDLALGDTVIGSGTRATYRGLPELSKATAEKSEGLTLTAKETTVGALTTADVCTYVKLTNLTVTEVYDKNGEYSNPNIKVADAAGNEIQIYKAVVGKTEGVWDVKVDDKVDVTAAVGVNNTTLQLRNTLASEITVRQPEVKGDRITDLSELTDGLTVAIYSPSHKTSVSSKPNGDWYLKANPATVENGKVQNFTQEDIWTVKLNENGTYSFYAYGDETRSITVWPSGSYAELSLNVATYPDNTWSLAPAVTEDCFYMSSATLTGTNRDGETGPAYVEAYIRNGTEVFSGYFVTPESNKFKESEFALQFYLVDPADALAAFDDGEWDGVLDKGKQYIVYNAAAEGSLGLAERDTYSLTAVPTVIEEGKAKAGNGAYVFTVDSMGRYYSFAVDGKFLATNNAEELFFAEPNEDGSAPETAKWFLTKNGEGYIIYNKEAQYGGTPVCIEFFSSVFSGWTFSTKNDVGIYLFNFYEPAEGTEIRAGVVQAPAVVFDCADFRFIEQDYLCSFTLDDLAEEITELTVTYTAGEKTGTVTELEKSEDGKICSFTIPAADIDAEGVDSLTIRVEVRNSYDISYSGEKTVEIIDEPFFTELTPSPNAQTRDEKKPTISAKIGNTGEGAEFTMTVNEQPVEAVFAEGVLSYTPAEELADGRVTVKVSVKRTDGVTAEQTWSFTIGIADYQLYFGQLHSHTTYSDGSGSLDTALEYIASLPKSANVQFVAFTDHSNYFDTTSAANPASALNDKTQMTEESLALWNEYKEKVAAFNATHSDIVAIAGFEMTWAGGPGHINTYDSDGLVSRNNSELNNKSGDAGMKLYYQIINQGASLNQFNHPGTTFGNFTDFSYWDAATDAHMFLVEVGNGEGQVGQGGYFPSYEQYIMALDKGWHVAPTNNQDNHKGRWGNANDARDVILTNDFTEQGIYDAIRALRVYATEDKNLQIFYTLDGKPMGTIFGDDYEPEKLKVEVNLYDPDPSDSISKVEVVVDGGVTAYTWDDAAELAEGSLTAELEPEYSYYFIRVTQADGNLAVTAPVWVGKAVKVGVTDIKAEAEPVYKDEEATLITTLFNDEAAAATVKSLVYTVNGSEVLGTDTTGYELPANGTLPVSFKHSFDKAKLTTVTVTATIVYDGKEYVKTASVELDVIDRENENTVSTIAEVRAASDPADTGYRFVLEGVLTSNASGYDKDTAFFDCVYVQDETAGICCFPVSGEYKIGDKVRIVGHTDFFQGEPELQVESIEVIGEGSVAPTEIKASELNDRSAEGKLVTVKGTVESVEEANGLIQTVMVKDAEGNLARVFIDGYITTAKEVENCVVGAEVEATGLASYDDTFNAPEGPFPRIRIRDRADVICTTAEPEKPVAPTVKPAAGEVEKGTELIFDTPTEGAEIEYSTDGGKTWTKGDRFTVNEDVTVQVKAVKDGLESEVVTLKYTVKAKTPAQEGTVTLDPNGGRVATTQVRLKDGKLPALPTPQERDGYLFAGWFDAKTGGLEVLEGDSIEAGATLYARWYELRAVATENAVVPTALKDKYSTVDAMKSAMLKTVQRRLGTTTVKGSKLYELKVEYYDGTQWLPVSADQFPAKGVQFSLALPSGSATNDRFVALHLFGEDGNGHKAGEGEMPTVTKSGTTLSFTVHGCSPLLLVWTGTGTNGNNGVNTRTGDESNLMLWAALMLASSAAMAALVIGQKKRKNRA